MSLRLRSDRTVRDKANGATAGDQSSFRVAPLTDGRSGTLVVEPRDTRGWYRVAKQTFICIVLAFIASVVLSVDSIRLALHQRQHRERRQGVFRDGQALHAVTSDTDSEFFVLSFHPLKPEQRPQIRLRENTIYTDDPSEPEGSVAAEHRKGGGRPLQELKDRHPDRVAKFLRRNHNDTDFKGALWVPGVEGMEQRNLDLWGSLTGKYIDAKKFTREDKQSGSPHQVGCYLAHWNLVRMLSHRPDHLRPGLYFVFEDDANCVPNLRQRVTELIGHLPPDWDVLYVGGKPFIQFRDEPRPDLFGPNPSRDTIRRDICLGAFGRAKGPLAPDGTRHLLTSNLYWQTKCTANTEAYVINARRVHRILEAMNPVHPTRPIDWIMARAMESGKINAYMPTEVWCRQASRIDDQPLHEPYPWEGYSNFKRAGIKNWTTIHPGMAQVPGGHGHFPHLWDTILLDDVDPNCEF